MNDGSPAPACGGRAAARSGGAANGSSRAPQWAGFTPGWRGWRTPSSRTASPFTDSSPVSKYSANTFDAFHTAEGVAGNGQQKFGNLLQDLMRRRREWGWWPG